MYYRNVCPIMKILLLLALLQWSNCFEADYLNWVRQYAKQNGTGGECNNFYEEVCGNMEREEKPSVLKMLTAILSEEENEHRMKTTCPLGWTKSLELGCLRFTGKDLPEVQARELCASLGAELPMPKTPAQNDDLIAFMNEKKVDVAWIGINDNVTEGTWVWNDGTPATWTVWNNAPKNKHYVGKKGLVYLFEEGANCARIQAGNGAWQQMMCGSTYSHLENIPGLPVVCTRNMENSIRKYKKGNSSSSGNIFSLPRILVQKCEETFLSPELTESFVNSTIRKPIMEWLLEDKFEFSDHGEKRNNTVASSEELKMVQMFLNVSNIIVNETVKRKIENIFERDFNALMLVRNLGGFVRFLAGQPVNLKEQCVHRIFFDRHLLGFLVGAKIVRKHGLTSKDIWDLSIMARKLEDAMYRKIANIDWLSETTKQLYAHKISKFTHRIGYPMWILDSDKLEEFYSDEREALPRLESLEFEDTLSALDKINHYINGTKIDRVKERIEWKPMDLWLDLNGYFSQRIMQTTIFLAYILPPYYKNSQPKAVNYGILGQVLGHELGHSFDSNGYLVGSDGNPHDWLSEVEKNRFEDRHSCFVQQYNQFCYEGIGCVLGNMTLSENIADAIGLELAYDAYQLEKLEDGAFNVSLNDDRLFFQSHARTYCRYNSNTDLKMSLDFDPHTPVPFRINGAFQNHPHFARSFRCKIGDPMVPEKQCSMWR